MLPALILLLASALAAYILIGYPLIIRFHPPGPPLRPSPNTPKVTAVLIVRHGAQWLPAKLDNLLTLDYPPEKLDVLVVAGDPESEALARRHPAQDRIRVLPNPAGTKSAGLNTALLHTSDSEALFMVDVRQRLAPDCLRRLCSVLADPAVGAVSGELRISQPGSASEANAGLYWRFEFWLRQRLSSIDSIFGATGAIYLIRRELAPPIPPQILLDDMFLPLHGFFAGYRLVVEPGAIAWDTPTGGAVEFRRKVRTLAGNYQLLAHYPQLLHPLRNRLWWHYLSYKLGRLLLPHLMLAAIGASFFLPPSWSYPLLSLQAFFLLLALADPWIAERIFLKRLSSPAFVFLSMMAAAFLAQAIFFIPAERLWRPTYAQNGSGATPC